MKVCSGLRVTWPPRSEEEEEEEEEDEDPKEPREVFEVEVATIKPLPLFSPP